MPRLAAGVAVQPIEAPLGGEMMGYALRQGGAEETRDPLFARALYLGSGADLLWVELDVCFIATGHAESLRHRIAERTGVPAERVMVACIHTHSGPDSGYAGWIRGDPEPGPEAWQRLADAALRAATSARAAAAPARLGVGSATARIGRNRRREKGPLDPEVLVIRVDREDGRPLAILYVYGCHPTVLGHENLAYSADWPGAASRVVEAALPGSTAIFALGAHADVDPRTRGLLDLAIDGQSRGAGFDAVEALGGEVGSAVAEAAAALPTSSDVEIAAATERVALPVHGAAEGDEARAGALARERERALAALDLDPSSEVGVGDLFRLSHERTRHQSRDEARPRIATVRRYLRDHTAARFAGGIAPEVAVQVFRLGDAWLLGLPAEATVDVGLAWKRRLGGAPGAVLSIANGWLRYLPHPDNFRESGADEAYEVLMSTFVPDAALRLLDAGDALRASLRTG
jgi:neutral ceramidase